MSKVKDVPVYLFTGFLESGKTTFIQQTLEDTRFCKGEPTLLLVCEEGEEEYAPERFADKCTFVKVLEGPEELTEERLAGFIRETGAERVMIEYNGMWMLDTLYEVMPEGWMVYQEFMFAEAGSFLSYNTNMRQLVYDKLKSCDLVVFNRFDDSLDKMAFHKIVRGANRQTDIAYEYPGDRVVYDDTEDPLPFNLDADIVEIGDGAFAEWYRDMADDPKKYEGKTVRFRCRALVRDKMPPNTFIVGRHVMTCCIQDVQFAGLACEWKDCRSIEDDSWILLTARVNIKYTKAYKHKGPVLSCISAEKCEEPEQPIATFY
ncbi:MAG: GTPase [Candidatus Limivicinus sp.]